VVDGHLFALEDIQRAMDGALWWRDIGPIESWKSRRRWESIDDRVDDKWTPLAIAVSILVDASNPYHYLPSLLYLAKDARIPLSCLWDGGKCHFSYAQIPSHYF
jgi:hypothetical protein